MNVEIKPATTELLTQYYGYLPKRSLCSVVAIQDNKVIGVSGYYNDKNRFVAFADFNEAVRRNKRIMVKGIRAVRELLRSKKLTVQILADPEVPDSQKLLKHIGSQPLMGDIYTWEP